MSYLIFNSLHEMRVRTTDLVWFAFEVSSHSRYNYHLFYITLIQPLRNYEDSRIEIVTDWIPKSV
jgi:hypothetical protein